MAGELKGSSSTSKKVLILPLGIDRTRLVHVMEQGPLAWCHRRIQQFVDDKFQLANRIVDKGLVRQLSLIGLETD